MTEYVSKDRLIKWLSPYLHTGEPIPADILISDIRMMPPMALEADGKTSRLINREQLKMTRWVKEYKSRMSVKEGCVCEQCQMWNERETTFCPHCGLPANGDGVNLVMSRLAVLDDAH